MTESYAEAVFALADELGLTGAVRHGEDLSDAELAAWYADADVFVCLSEHEGFCIPLLEAMRSGLPIVAYSAGAVPETLGDAGILIESKRPSVVAAPSTGSDGTAAWPTDWSPPGHRRLRISAGDHPGPFRRGPAALAEAATAGGRVKLAFVTPSLRHRSHRRCGSRGPNVGRAPVPATRLGGRGDDQLRTRPPYLGEHRTAGDARLNGVTVHRFPTASRRLLDYFELDAKLRLSPTTATLAESRRWVALNGPMCPGLVDAVAATDADVVACYPYLFATTVDGIAVSKVPTVLHPAAHDEPALYLSAFRRSFRDLDGFVYHTQAERDLMEYAFGVGPGPRSSWAWGSMTPPGQGGAGGDLLGLGERPYLCYLGRVDEHKGCGMLAEYFERYKERRPGDLRWPSSARSPTRRPTIPTSWSPERCRRRTNGTCSPAPESWSTRLPMSRSRWFCWRRGPSGFRRW